VQPEQHHRGGGDPHRQAAPVARLATFAANNARPTLSTTPLMAAITLAPVNSIPAGPARSPTMAMAAEDRSSSAAGPKNWSASEAKAR
jgi:hypothetical protein